MCMVQFVYNVDYRVYYTSKCKRVFHYYLHCEWPSLSNERYFCVSSSSLQRYGVPPTAVSLCFVGGKEEILNLFGSQ